MFTFTSDDDESSSESSYHQSGTNRDVQGVARGQCSFSGCDCTNFSYIVSQGPKCSVCGHTPVKHVKESDKLTARGPISQADELEKDSSTRLFAPNSPPFSKFHNISISSDNSSPSSDLTLIDMEQDQDSLPPVKPKGKIRSLLTGAAIKKQKVHSDRMLNMADSSLVPVQDTYQPPTAVAPVHASLPPQSFSGFQPDGLMSMQTFSPPANPSLTLPTAYPQPLPMLQMAPQSAAQPTCMYAGCTRSVFVEPSGRVHQFCGRTHANMYHSGATNTAGGQAAAVPPHLKCSNLLCKRMKYQENGKYLDFCGRSCRDSYRQSQQLQGPQVSPANMCVLSGCNNPKSYDSTNNVYFDFCGKTCANKAKSNLFKKASDSDFQRIKNHFNIQWASGKGACGHLHEVLVIDNPKLKHRFEKYRSTLSVPSVSQYFHGTSLKCAVYQTSTPCTDKHCGICGVSWKGILPEFRSSNIKFQRFGNGFYFAPNSSKCHDYTQGYDKYRAMLMFDVAEGNKYIVKDDNKTLQKPPQGFDSVYGKHGGSLNYDEIVVYTSEALLPTHVLIYIKDGIHKIAT